MEKSLSYQPGPRPEPKSKRGRPRKTRDQPLPEPHARIRALAPASCPSKAMKHIENKVTLLYEDMHRFEERANRPT